MLNCQFRRVRLWAAILSAAVLGAVVWCVPAAWAQTPPLAEVARKEQERRKTNKPPTKVYTNKDLPESAKVQNPRPSEQAPAPSPSSHGGSQAAPAGDAKPGEAKPEAAEKDEKWWRNRITQAREELRRNEVFAEALQTRINSLSADFTSRDDPFQRAKVGEDRDKALGELARVKAEVARGKQQIEDIEEEARKAGVPPGWLR